MVHIVKKNLQFIILGQILTENFQPKDTTKISNTKFLEA